MLALAVAMAASVECTPEPGEGSERTQPGGGQHDSVSGKRATSGASEGSGMDKGAALAARTNPVAFLPLQAPCPQGYQRFDSACVHERHLLRTRVTELMNQLVDYRNGKPSPRVDLSESAAARAQAAASEPAPAREDDSARVARAPVDPSRLSPGALTATPEEQAEAERARQMMARNRGELPAESERGPGGPKAAPDKGASKPESAGINSAPKQGTAAPSPSGSDSDGMRAALEKVAGGQIGSDECQSAKQTLTETASKNCYLPESEHAACAEALKAMQQAVDSMCSAAK